MTKMENEKQYDYNADVKSYEEWCTKSLNMTAEQYTCPCFGREGWSDLCIHPTDGGCSGLNVCCDGDILYIISYCLNCNVINHYTRKKILNGELTPDKETNKKIKQIVNTKLQHPNEDIMHLPFSSF